LKLNQWLLICIIQKLKHLKRSLSASNSDDELLKAIKTLKNGKSATIDSVSNEMIKYGMATKRIKRFPVATVFRKLIY
jgi:hypothetical protein